MRFKSLGSGSAGNAMLIESKGENPFRVLIDCGLGIRQLQARLAQADLQISDVQAVFITHEHGDHIGCAHSLSLRHRIPVWMSRGTYAAIGEPDFDGLLRIARDGEPVYLDRLQLHPFTVPHDAREPLQLCCSDGTSKLGILTDLGHSTAHILENLQNCDALVLECNHDVDMLAQSVYPPFLKRRVGGEYGHLSNAAAAEVLRAVMHRDTRHVVAAHLSAQNNRPEIVRELLAETLSCNADEILIAGQQDGTGWLQI